MPLCNKGISRPEPLISDYRLQIGTPPPEANGSESHSDQRTDPKTLSRDPGVGGDQRTPRRPTVARSRRAERIGQTRDLPEGRFRRRPRGSRRNEQHTVALVRASRAFRVAARGIGEALARGGSGVGRHGAWRTRSAPIASRFDPQDAWRGTATAKARRPLGLRRLKRRDRVRERRG